MKSILTFLILFVSSVFLSAEQEMIGDLSIPFAMEHSKVLGEISCRLSSPDEPLFCYELNDATIEVTEREFLEDLDLGWIVNRFPDLNSRENIIKKMYDSMDWESHVPGSDEEYERLTKEEIRILMKKKYLKEKAIYRISDLIQKGKASVYNKKKNVYVKEIILAEYGHHSGPRSGEGGKLFIFKESGICFWKVMEWVS